MILFQVVPYRSPMDMVKTFTINLLQHTCIWLLMGITGWNKPPFGSLFFQAKRAAQLDAHYTVAQEIFEQVALKAGVMIQQKKGPVLRPRFYNLISKHTKKHQQQNNQLHQHQSNSAQVVADFLHCFFVIPVVPVRLVGTRQGGLTRSCDLEIKECHVRLTRGAKILQVLYDMYRL